MVVGPRRSASITGEAGGLLRTPSVRRHCGRSIDTGPARRLHSGESGRSGQTNGNTRVMIKNDKNQEIETETETETDGKPQVRIVDLEEVREVLGAAAAAQGMAAKPGDTTMCSW